MESSSSFSLDGIRLLFIILTTCIIYLFKVAWLRLNNNVKDYLPPMPSRLVTDEDLKVFYNAMKIYEAPDIGMKRKSENVGGLDTQQYGRGKRAREVCMSCVFLFYCHWLCLVVHPFSK